MPVRHVTYPSSIWTMHSRSRPVVMRERARLRSCAFFGGLTLEETGDLLAISVATVEREWQAARAWLYARLTRQPPRRALRDAGRATTAGDLVRRLRRWQPLRGAG